MGTYAEFRNYAQQCIDIARKTNNRTLRETMLEMAETWLGMAGASQAEFEQVMAGGRAMEAKGSGQGPDAALPQEADNRKRDRALPAPGEEHTNVREASSPG